MGPYEVLSPKRIRESKTCIGQVVIVLTIIGVAGFCRPSIELSSIGPHTLLYTHPNVTPFPPPLETQRGGGSCVPPVSDLLSGGGSLSNL
jgi:hypothetical protein